MMYDIPHSPSHLSPSSRPRNRSPYEQAQHPQPGYPSPARSDTESITHMPDALGVYGYPPTEVPTTPQSYLSSPQTTGSFWDGPITSTCSYDTLTSPSGPWQQSEHMYSATTATTASLCSPVDWPRPSIEVSSYQGFTSEVDQFSRHSPLSSGHSPCDGYVIDRIESSKSIRASPMPIKVEEHTDWFSNPTTAAGYATMPTTQQPTTISPAHLSGYTIPYPSTYYTGLSDSHYHSRAGSVKSTHSTSFTMSDNEQIFDSGPEMTPDVAEDKDSNTTTDYHRIRIRRRTYTSAEDANFRCDICSKPFQRLYNYKQHQATHDKDRRRPHVCTHPTCSKSFVRKTDLDRHDQSVHQMSKRFKCPRCETHFARKDTLRRHYEDGCPKRTEFLQKQSPALTPITTRMPMNSRSTSFSSINGPGGSGSSGGGKFGDNSMMGSPAAQAGSAARRSGTDRLDASTRLHARRSTSGVSVKQESLSPVPSWR